MLCFYLDSQTCRKAWYFLVWSWGNARHPPSSARSSQLSQKVCGVKGTQRISSMGESLISVQFLFSFHFPLFPLSSLVSEAASQEPFRYLQLSSRLPAELGISSCNGDGKVLWMWCLENLSVCLSPSGCSSDAAPHFLCCCTLLCPIWNFLSTLLNVVS